MHQSSSTIGSIAGALAKAQAELTNPEKSLTASIRLSPRMDHERTFRYAPLSSGLDIVRKCLGKHEIAAIQTTAIDKDAGMVRLVTVLAHTSGEWISSDWPVCMIADIASPRRMGAALTYARRYALFTLVGIAGEDDLDAPDLDNSRNGANSPLPHPVIMNGAFSAPAQRSSPPFRNRPALLTSEQSAATRDELMMELTGLASADDLVEWARQSMPVKNTLSPADANVVEAAFQAKMTMVSAQTGETPGTPAVASAGMTPHADHKTTRMKPSARKGSSIRAKKSQTQAPIERPVVSTGIDKSVLAIPTLKRHRNKPLLRFVATQACLVCGREPSDAHHLRFAQPRGLGQKVSDEFTVPLCRTHHREVHRNTKERDWWNKLNIDPLTIANALWDKSSRGQASVETA